MEMGVCFIYILLLIYIEHGDWKNIAEKALRIFGIFVLTFLCYFNMLQANRAYSNMNLSYEKTYGVCSNLLDRIEQLDDYPRVSRVALFGDYEANSLQELQN